MSTLNRRPFGRLALALLAALCCASLAAADGGVLFENIVGDESGLVYQRTPSQRDVLWNAIKQGGTITVEDIRFVPIRSRGVPGVAILDYDRDGDLDLYVTNGPGTPSSLFASQWAETGELRFVDVAEMAGVATTDMDANGICYGDIDNDGDHDLYITGAGEPNRLFENQGDGTFLNITETSGAGGAPYYRSGCSMGDIDGDGLLDIFVANTAQTWDDRSAIAVEPFDLNIHNELFVNRGNNVFEEVSEARGLHHQLGFLPEFEGSPGLTWASAMVDYDYDGDLDIFTADDQGSIPFVAADPIEGIDRGLLHLYRNDGTGHFTDINTEAGIGTFGAWMGLSFGDLNADGHMDFFASNLGDYLVTAVLDDPPPAGLEPSRWFLGRGDGTFEDPGVGDMVTSPFGWGTVMLDYENDGDTDILYHGGLDIGPLVEASNHGVLFRNGGTADFDVDFEAFASTNHTRRNVGGVAAGDLNGDGFVDVVSVSNMDFPDFIPLIPFPPRGSVFDATAAFVPTWFPPEGPNEPFTWTGIDGINGSLAVEINGGGNGHRGLAVHAQGTVGVTSEGRVNRDGIGAIVYFRTPRGKHQVVPVLGGASHASQDSLAAHFGLGDERRGMVEVLWPGGVRNRLYGARAAERDIVFPEIPCSYDAEWESFTAYSTCVNTSLTELREAGYLNVADQLRFFVSAVRAFLDGRLRTF